MILKIEQPAGGAPAEDPATVAATIPAVASETLLQRQRSNQQDVEDSVRTLLEDPELDLMYRDAKTIRDQINTTQIDENNIKFLQNMLKEYLNSFVIAGYDLKGRRVYVQYTSKQADTDALQKYVENIANSNLIGVHAQQRLRQEDEDEDDDD